MVYYRAGSVFVIDCSVIVSWVFTKASVLQPFSFFCSDFSVAFFWSNKEISLGAKYFPLRVFKHTPVSSSLQPLTISLSPSVCDSVSWFPLSLFFSHSYPPRFLQLCQLRFMMSCCNSAEMTQREHIKGRETFEIWDFTLKVISRYVEEAHWRAG